MKSRRTFLQSGFSLVELLVASAILLVLLLALLSMTNSTVLFAKLAQRKMDSASSLRSSMDRMTADLSSAILREDLPPLFVRSTAADGSDEFYLHSQAEGYDGERGISVIGYRVRDGKLERGAQGSGWMANFLRFAEALRTNTIQSQNFDVVGAKVFRLKVEFLGKDGAMLTNSTPPTNWNQVSAVVLNLAAIDAKALQIAGGSQKELAELLPGLAANPSAGILADWQETLNDPGFFGAGGRFPAEARQGIEVRRRIVPLAN